MTGVVRRRFRSHEEKREIVEESLRSGSSIAAVASQKAKPAEKRLEKRQLGRRAAGRQIDMACMRLPGCLREGVRPECLFPSRDRHTRAFAFDPPPRYSFTNLRCREPAVPAVQVIRFAPAETRRPSAARLARLNGRAGHRSVGTEHAAIAGKRLEKSPAGRAVPEILTGVGGHGEIVVDRATLRAGQGRFRCDLTIRHPCRPRFLFQSVIVLSNRAARSAAGSRSGAG